MSPVAPATSSSSLTRLTTVPALLDSLVRNTRGGVAPETLTQRLFDLWRESSDRLDFGPDGIRVGDVAPNAKGGWSFHAFMAGLRSVSLTETTEFADVQRLARELASVRFDADSAERLRNWTWEEDGDAFAFTVTQSFAEALQATELAPELAATGLSALRAGGLQALEGPRLQTSALDRAATRPEFEIALEGYRAESMQRGHEVDGQMMRMLADGCANASAWAELELAELARAGRLATMSSARLAKRIVETLAGQRPERAFEFLSTLESDEPELAQKVTALVDLQTLLHTLANAAKPRAVAKIVAGWLGEGSEFAQRVLAALLEGASGDTKLAPIADSVLDADPVAERLADLVDASKLDAPKAAWLLSRARPDAARALLEALDPEITTTALCAMKPGALLSGHHGAVGRVLQTGSFEARNTLASHLAATTAKDEEQLLARALLDSSSETWGARAAYLVCNRVRDAGMTRDVLLPLAKSRKTTASLRVAALHVLEVDPTALRAATRWSPTEWFAPPEVRAALKKARKRDT